MCTVSMIGDSFTDRYRPKFPEWFPNTPFPTVPITITPDLEPKISRKEFEALKAEVELLKDLLKRAAAYDLANHEPNCESDEKLALLRLIAKAVGVNLD